MVQLPSCSLKQVLKFLELTQMTIVLLCRNIDGLIEECGNFGIILFSFLFSEINSTCLILDVSPTPPAIQIPTGPTKLIMQ